MDFFKNKDSLFTGSSTNVEKVEVNQRHLIDKILARYSAEFTVYRELIQNANDAGASEVQIEFITGGFNSSDKKMIKNIVIKNNGRAFTNEDWARLKKIAEGNPDEQKIGFFGVGFYSLFSICEEPLVISGSKCLGFYWTGDQLYTKSANYTENTLNWTNICLELREPLELPEFDEFGQFLCKSLLFTYSLSVASFYVDGKLMLNCSKTLSPSSNISFSNYKTSSNLFNLKSIEERLVQMTIEKNYKSIELSEIDTSSASSVFSSLWRMAQNTFTEKGKEESLLDSKLRQPGTFHIFLKHFRASSLVQTTTKFAGEMERTTKKKPFQNINVDLIYINYEQLNATSGESIEGSKISIRHPILSKLLPFPTNGKVFIGFETHQTSGLGIHFTAPFIPTVERESIDFVDSCLKIWNIELIQLSGRICRIIYENEVNSIRFEGDPDYMKKSKHLMEAFNFKNSTPSQIVGFTLFDEFLRFPTELKLPSSNGFVSSRFLRHVPEEMLKFVRNTPRIPNDISTVCQQVLQKLAVKQQRSSSNLIQTISVRDVIDFELKNSNSMTENEKISCLNWWIKILNNTNPHFSPQITQELANEFADHFLVTSAQGNATRLPLSKMTFYAGDELSGLYFSETAKIKFFPIDCVSPEFSSNFSKSDLCMALGLQELNLADWMNEIVKWTLAKDAIESDSELSEQLLLLLSKHYNTPPRSINASIFQGEICNSLSTLKCIPIGEGILKKPSECYFEDVPQLQVSMNIIIFSSESRRSRVNETMLKASGVHAHLPIDEIFANIDKLKWDHVSLIKYLVRVKDELSKSDITKLKMTPIFPDSKETNIYVLSELYADSINPEIIRILDLKILKWASSGIPKEGSEIGDFLMNLDFNYIVPWIILLKGVKNATQTDRLILFKYFFENFSCYQDYDPSKINFPYIPVESENENDVSVFLPCQVFLDGPLNHLEFYLIHPDLRKYSQMLGIKERPSTISITKQILALKLNRKKTEEIFSYCSRISNEFTKEDWKLFRQSDFIPCFCIDGTVEYKTFDKVFLPSNGSNSFANLFDEVDFGIQANSFLRSVGVVDEPRAENLIALLLKDSSKILTQLKPAKYIEMMERISDHWHVISSKHLSLAKSFIGSNSFIGSVHIKVETKSEAESDFKDEKLQYSLYKIDDVFLIDDVISQQLFNLPIVPINLEQFYLKLGSRWISSVIRSEWKFTGQVRSEGPLIDSTRKILSERLNLISNSLSNGDEEGKIIKGGKKRFEAAKLFQVDSILILRTCTVNKQTNSQPSCAFTDAAAAHPSIYLSKNSDGQFDYFDLAAVIVNLLCDKKGRLQDSLLIASLLTTPLSSLRAKGFQIENHIKPDEATILPPPKSEIQIKTSPKNNASTESGLELKNESPKIKGLKLEESKNEDDEKSIQNISTKSNSRSDNKWAESLLGFFKKASESFSSSESLIKIPQSKGKAGDGLNEESLRKALDRGIKSLKPHKSGDFDSVIPPESQFSDEPAPNNSQVQKELNSYCSEVSSLKFIGKMGKVDIYAGSSISPSKLNSFFSDNKDSLVTFYGLIIDELGSGVFKIDTQGSTLHIYYDPESSTIAFNRNHSLFFNFAYFLANRHDLILTDKSSDTRSVQRCKSFWFMTFCHELAHNFVHAHDSQHEFYLASFAETYLPDFIEKI